MSTVETKAGRKALGWVPDIPDHRDHEFMPMLARRNLPPMVDLSGSRFMPPIWDQGEIGSCTAHGIARCVQFVRRKSGLPDFMPSRLFIYYGEREMENTILSDAGAMTRDGMKLISKKGVPPETFWPYDVAKFTAKPTPLAYARGIEHKASYQRVARGLAGIKGCLAEGFPLTCGLTIYDSFESDAVAATGVVPMPGNKEESVGGHLITIVGYNDSTRLFKGANSWSATWGDKGYFYVPYDYLLDPNLADDFWTCRLSQ